MNLKQTLFDFASNHDADVALQSTPLMLPSHKIFFLTQQKTKQSDLKCADKNIPDGAQMFLPRALCRRHENFSPLLRSRAQHLFFLGQDRYPRSDTEGRPPEKVGHETPPRHVALHAARQRHESAGPRGLERYPHHQPGLHDRHEGGRYGRRAVMEAHGNLPQRGTESEGVV